MVDLKFDLVFVLKGSEDETSSAMPYPTQYINQDPYLHQDDDQQQGWVSWAWSFVPAIVSYDDEENDSSGIDDGTTLHQQKSQSLKDPIVSIGFYCTKATVTFKVSISLCRIGFIWLVEKVLEDYLHACLLFDSRRGMLQ